MFHLQESFATNDPDLQFSWERSFCSIRSHRCRRDRSRRDPPALSLNPLFADSSRADSSRRYFPSISIRSCRSSSSRLSATRDLKRSSSSPATSLPGPRHPVANFSIRSGNVGACVLRLALCCERPFSISTKRLPQFGTGGRTVTSAKKFPAVPPGRHLPGPGQPQSENGRDGRDNDREIPETQLLHLSPAVGSRVMYSRTTLSV
jgi:hypothetical protein